MLEAIRALGKAFGDSHGCIVCHGGTPEATTKMEAHKGSPAALAVAGPTEFYPDPGSLTIANRTCGMCHPTHHYRLEPALIELFWDDDVTLTGTVGAFALPDGGYDMHGQMGAGQLKYSVDHR